MGVEPRVAKSSPTESRNIHLGSDSPARGENYTLNPWTVVGELQHITTYDCWGDEVKPRPLKDPSWHASRSFRDGGWDLGRMTMLLLIRADSPFGPTINVLNALFYVSIRQKTVTCIRLGG